MNSASFGDLNLAVDAGAGSRLIVDSNVGGTLEFRGDAGGGTGEPA